MDLSKLPRLSKTPPSAGAPADSATEQGPPPAVFSDRQAADTSAACRPALGGGAEAWIGIAVGLILLLAYPRLPQYVCHKLVGTYFAPYTLGDQEVSYTSTLDFWSDLGITLFAVAMLLDGLILAMFLRRPGILLALAVTATATLYNAGYLVGHLLPLPLVSALAVAVGVYMITVQWGLWKALRSG